MSKITFDYGVTHTWIEDGQVLLIETLGDMRREAIDSWANSTITAVREWPHEGDFYTIHKLDAKDQGITPYARKRTQDIIDQLPDGRTAFTALILPDSFINQVIALFLRSATFRHSNHHERIFTRFDEGLAWIRSKLSKEKKA